MWEDGMRNRVRLRVERGTLGNATTAARTCTMGRWLLFLTLLLTAPALWAGGGWPAEDPGPKTHVVGCAIENVGFYRGNDILSPGLHWG